LRPTRTTRAEQTPWLTWGAGGALLVGLGVLSVGLYVDHARDRQTVAADGCVVAGLLLVLVSSAVFWL
jgi:hypothetical protein